MLIRYCCLHNTNPKATQRIWQQLIVFVDPIVHNRRRHRFYPIKSSVADSPG
ncbi:MAG: hypothetical protein V7K97_24260 [Nostoc sp.]